MSSVLFRNLNPELIQYRKDICYRTQIGLCITEAFKRRGYTKSQQNWDVMWAEKECLETFYANNRVKRDKKINHFRTYYEICRKDNLNRNLKKHKRNLEKEGKVKQAAEYNFAPLSYHFPAQFAFFCEEFKKIASSNKSNIWIMKPTAKSQGKGIFLFNKLSSIQQWAQNPQAQAYICQKYIQNPLLIGHKKFDLRLYVLCTSYRPLTIYMYRQGFARFTHFRYDDSNINESQIHLTNVAIQKHTQQYSKVLGGKWMLSSLKLYMISKFGYDATNVCFSQIKNLVVKTLRSVSKIMSNQSNCFELYGFDVMLDANLKPWLIQVNGSPSMRANTKKDKQLKVGVIDDLLTIIDLENIMSSNEDIIGGFDLICKKENNYEPEYYVNSNFSMLGCKLEREKYYRRLATALNSYHKNKQKTPNIGNSKTYSQRPSVDFDQISTQRKMFSIRKQRPMAQNVKYDASKVSSIQIKQKSTLYENNQGNQNKSFLNSNQLLNVPRRVDINTNLVKNSNLMKGSPKDIIKIQKLDNFGNASEKIAVKK